MGELPCSNVMPKGKWGREKGEVKPNIGSYSSLFVVGHPINMYEVIKLNGMSA